MPTWWNLEKVITFSYQIMLTQLLFYLFVNIFSSYFLWLGQKVTNWHLVFLSVSLLKSRKISTLSDHPEVLIWSEERARKLHPYHDYIYVLRSFTVFLKIWKCIYIFFSSQINKIMLVFFAHIMQSWNNEKQICQGKNPCLSL